METSVFNSPEISVGLLPLLWIIWLVFLAVFIVFGSILFYHWIKYDWTDKKVRRGSWLFAFGGILLLAISATSIFII